MQPLIVPPAIKPGQKIRIITPSGALREWERFERGVQVWHDRGYEVYIPPNIDKSWGYLAGSDEARRQQLKEAWLDPDCVAVMCARGGYGTTRLLENWSWQELGATPKWLIGFSDITALLWSLAVQSGMASIHGPVITTLATEPPESIEKLFDWLEGRSDRMTLTGKGWHNGKVTGVLLPANLNVATHLLGTPLCPDLHNVILAFEDIAEPPYKVDRMLTHWRHSGVLKHIKGIALGRFSSCEPSSDRPSLSMEEVWRDRLTDLNIPIVIDLPFGHEGINTALVIGCNAELDADFGTLTYWQ